MPKPVSIRARRCGSLSRLKRENGTRNKTATTGARYCNTSPSMRKWAAGVTTRTCGMGGEGGLRDGEVGVGSRSSTQMTVGEFYDYRHAVRANAVMRLGVAFE